MKTIRKVLLFIFGIQWLFIFFVGCQGDDTFQENCFGLNPIEQEACNYTILDFSTKVETIDSTFNFDDCPTGFYTVYPNKYRYAEPVYNPNNDKEIAFIRRENNLFGLFNSELCVFNFCTSELNILTNTTCIEETIDWSRKNWIAFIGPNFQLYKMKSDGDSLTQLTNFASIEDPSWSFSGDSLAFEVNKSSGNQFVIVDENIKVLDTIIELNYAARQKKSANELIAFAGWGAVELGVHYYDPKTKSATQIEYLDLATRVLDTDWSVDNNSIVWTAPQQISETNIFTFERTTIETGANNRVFQSSALSPDGKKIILQQLDRRKISNCEMEVLSLLYIMDANGANKRRIDFPE